MLAVAATGKVLGESGIGKVDIALQVGDGHTGNPHAGNGEPHGVCECAVVHAAAGRPSSALDLKPLLDQQAREADPGDSILLWENMNRLPMG
ncbi:MAG: hypothetical protein LCH60_03620 [Actinobacteria bacterium]|nr:hypothetical protein [Actinomycetota bacterium]